MRVSRNELTALLCRVFEGQGFIDFDAAAKQVVWLEQCGLQGLMRLAGCIDFLQQADRSPPRLEEEPGGHMVMDCVGNSALALGVSATELMYTEALWGDATSFTLERFRNRMFILQPLSDCASRGMYCLAHWRQPGAASVERLALFGAGQRHPSMQVREARARVASESEHTMVLMCSENAGPLHTYQGEQHDRTGPVVSQWDAEVLGTQHKRALDEGFEISGEFWHGLLRLGERVLVESTDTSRARGAGPAGN